MRGLSLNPDHQEKKIYLINFYFFYNRENKRELLQRCLKMVIKLTKRHFFYIN